MVAAPVVVVLSLAVIPWYRKRVVDTNQSIDRPLVLQMVISLSGPNSHKLFPLTLLLQFLDLQNAADT